MPAAINQYNPLPPPPPHRWERCIKSPTKPPKNTETETEVCASMRTFCIWFVQIIAHTMRQRRGKGGDWRGGLQSFEVAFAQLQAIKRIV